MRASLTLFEAMLDGRDHLLGDDFGAADCAAFPFLKYGLWLRDDDDERFHRILAEHLALDGSVPADRGLAATRRRAAARSRRGRPPRARLTAPLRSLGGPPRPR